LQGRTAKILYHHRTVAGDGQRVHIDEMIAAWQRLGHQVILAEPKSQSAGRMGADDQRIARLKHVLPAALYELAELLYSIRAFVKLYRLYVREKPDVLYERYTTFMLAGCWLKALTGIPYLCEVNAPLSDERYTHGQLKLRSLAKLCERWTWRAADKVFPVSGVLKQYLEDHHIPGVKIDVIHNGIDPERFADVPAEEQAKARLGLEGKTVLGFVGFARDWHGLNRTFPLLEQSQDRVLLIVGDGPARADLEAEAHARGLANQLRFTGYLAREAIAEHIMAFNVALQPDVVPYASPLKLFEYMALGRAIVAPCKANICEILTHEESALLFDADNPDAFAQCVERLCADEAARRTLGRAAKQRIEEGQFYWEANAKRILDHAANLERLR